MTEVKGKRPSRAHNFRATSSPARPPAERTSARASPPLLWLKLDTVQQLAATLPSTLSLSTVLSALGSPRSCSPHACLRRSRLLLPMLVIRLNS